MTEGEAVWEAGGVAGGGSRKDTWRGNVGARVFIKGRELEILGKTKNIVYVRSEVVTSELDLTWT